MSSETTITTNIKVNGLSQLKEAGAAYKQLREAASGSISGGFASKLNSELEKSISSATKLSEKLRTLTESGSSSNSMTKMREELTQSTSAAEKLNSALRQSRSTSSEMAGSTDKMASAQTRAAEAATRASEAQRRASQQHGQAVQSANQIATSSAKAESSWGKIKGAVKDSLAMFSIGMLGASAVNGVVSGAKSALKGGFDTIKERQQGQAMWATSIQDAHSGMSGKELDKASALANRQMMSTAIKAGNDYSQANQMAKQVYSSDAGEYSGNLKKTNALVTGMFNIQDANALNEQEMQRFTTAVGNIGDTGKMSGTIAKSLNFLDGKMTRRMRDEYKAETGKTLAKTKSGAWDYGKINAQTAYRALDKYGNSGGVGKASERINSTLGGVIRAGKSAINNGMADFETRFAERVNKSFGGKGGLIGKLAGFFTNSNNITKIANGAADKLSSLAVNIGKVGKVAAGVVNDVKPFAKQFSGGFAKGFTSEMKQIGASVKTAYGMVKGVGKKLGSMIPKGAASNLGQVAGKVTAALVAFRGFAKLPGMGKTLSAAFKPALALIKQIPVIGTSLSGFVAKVMGLKQADNTAGGKMMSAANTMMSAAECMNGGSGNGSGDGTTMDALTRSGPKSYTRFNGELVESGNLTRSQKLISRGQALLGETGSGVGSRMAQNASWFTKLKGKSLVGLGSLGEKIGGSAIGKIGAGIAKGVGGAGKFLKNGMPGMNALFAGMDVLNTLSSTKSGSLARHKGVGSAVGGGVGATIGGAAGSLLGPLGTVAGGVAGQWVGSKVGSWVGGLFGGTTKKKASNKSKAAKMYAKAQADYTQQQTLEGLIASGGAKNKAQAKAQSRVLGRAQGVANQGVQNHVFKAGTAASSGDMKTYTAETKAAAAATAKFYAARAKSARKSAASAKSDYNYNKKLAKQNADNAGYQLAADQAKAKYNKAKKKAASASSKANKADKDSVKLGNQSVNAEKKHTKAVKATGKAQADNAKKAKKNGAETEKSNKKASKSFSTLTKAQAKELRKQVSALKTAKAKQQKLVKTANSKQKAAERKAAKDIGKADKAAAKAMSKNYKTASKEISKAISSGMKTAASKAKAGSKKISTGIKSGLKNVGKSVKSALSKPMASAVKSEFSKAKSAAKSGGKGIVTAVKSSLKSMNSSIKSQFSKVGTAAKSGLSKVSSAVKSGMSKANSAFTSAFAKMASTANRASAKIAATMAKIGTAASSAASKVQSLQSAINSLKSKTITITANVKGKGAGKLATGTPGAVSSFRHLAGGTPGWAHNGGVKAGSYMVNDSKSGHWLEAFKTKSGLVGLFPPKRNLMVHLGEGDQVLNGNDTHRLFPQHLATGTPGAKAAMAKGGAPVINITVNVTGGTSDQTVPQKIANAIGEKMQMIFPTLEV